MKILFLSFTCEDIGVAMVTNMTSQLQEILLRHAVGSFEKKIVFHVGISSVSIKQIEYYMTAWGYEFYHSKIKFVNFHPFYFYFTEAFTSFLQ